MLSGVTTGEGNEIITVLISSLSCHRLYLTFDLNALTSKPIPPPVYNMAYSLILYSPQAKNGFYIFKWLGKKIL